MRVEAQSSLGLRGGHANGVTPTSHFRRVMAKPWLGLIPFLLFLVLFLFIPAVSVFSNALRTSDGWSLSTMGEAMTGQNLEAFRFSVTFSMGAALVGVVFGVLLAYAAATTRRPSWLRGVVTSFSGVAANLGGLPLAFAFLSLLGRQGLLTKLLAAMGLDIYSGDFTLVYVHGHYDRDCVFDQDLHCGVAPFVCVPIYVISPSISAGTEGPSNTIPSSNAACARLPLWVRRICPSFMRPPSAVLGLIHQLAT